MNAPRKSLAHRLDALANVTGIPQLTMRTPRRRPMRWLPVVTMVAATGALAVAMIAPDHDIYARGLLYVCFICAIFMSQFGPIKRGTRYTSQDEKIDEWDMALRARAYPFSYWVMALLSSEGFILLSGFAGYQEWSMKQLERVMFDFAFYMLVLFLSLPTLYASWTTKPLRPTDDDADSLD
jgi:hypothetical protein